MNEPLHDQKLTRPTSDLDRIDQLCEQFEDACRAGQRPRIEEHLDQVDEPDRPALFEQLLPVELHWRRQRGEEPSPEEYLARFPQFTRQIELALKGKAMIADDLLEGVTEEQFVESLVQSGLMSTGEVWSFRQSLPPDSCGGSAHQFARELIKQGKLTPYQAATIDQGKLKDLVLGEYTILDEVGAGGMGRVFKARHRTMERIVAIKVLSSRTMDLPEAVSRFRQEVKAAAQLMHPNIVTAHDAGECNGVHYLVMEYVEGSDLAKVVKEQGPVPVAQSVDYATQTAQGLEYAHDRGIIHRDIKPANLLVDTGGTVKISDLGLARLAQVAGQDQTESCQPLTSSQHVMGTCDFMSPEQVSDAHSADRPADIYSLGCTLHFLLTGRPPYRRETVMDTLLAHREAEIPSLREACPDVPETLDAIFQKMLAKTQEDRQQSMTEVIAELKQCLVPEPVPVAAPTPAPSEDLAAPSAESQMDVEAADTASEEWSRATEPSISPEERPPEPRAESTSSDSYDGPPRPSKQEDTEESTGSEAHRTSESEDRRGLAHFAESSEQKVPVPLPANGLRARPRSKRPLIAAACAVAALLVAVAFGVVFMLKTSEGTIIVEVDQPDAQVSINDGEFTITTPGDAQPVKVRLEKGEHALTVSKGGFETQTKQFTIRSRGQEVVRVRLVPLEAKAGTAKVEATSEPDMESWKKILPPDSPPPAIAPFNAATAKKHQEAWTDYLGVPVEQDVDLGGGVKLTMVLIPPGEFLMGTSDQEVARLLEDETTEEGINVVSAEGPQHRVRITKPFRLSRHEVTRGQFRRFAEETGYKTRAEQFGDGVGYVDGDWVRDPRFVWTDPGFPQTDDHPVVNVSWNDAIAFCQWLSKKEGVGFVLPTEAQWEYACRAGTTTAWSCGDNDRKLIEYAWFHWNSDLKTHAVGQLMPNSWELYDIHGNASEWCADLWDKDYAARSPTNDPSGPPTGRDRTFRGGCFRDTPTGCRSARGVWRTTHHNYSSLGFRLASFSVETERTAMRRVGNPYPDRPAAEWVQSIGGEGSLIVGGSKQSFDPDTKLPEKPFHVTDIELNSNPAVTDAGLANLAGLSHLEYLGLRGTPTRDDWLANLTGLSRLSTLYLGDTPITDAGLAYLADLPRLQNLGLAETAVGDAGLRHVAKMNGLTILGLWGTKVTGRGLEHLVTLDNLRILDLMHTEVGDDDLRPLQNLPELRMLVLVNTHVTDAGLPHLLRLEKLEWLDLPYGVGKVTAASLGELRKLPRLKALKLSGYWTGSDTAEALKKLPHLSELYYTVTDGTQEPDVAALQAALPNCRIETTMEAARTAYNKHSWKFREEADAPGDPDRRAAEWVRSIGGILGIQGQGDRNYGDPNVELPDDPFHVAFVDLGKNPAVTDAGLANVAGLSHLEFLTLSSTPITDTGLTNLTGLSRLQQLNLGDTAIGDVGLACLADLLRLRTLILQNTHVTDAGLSHVGKLKGLAFLSLNGTKITGRGLEHLVGLSNLRVLRLSPTDVGDDDMRPLQSLANLRMLDLGVTQVTDAGLPHLLKLEKLEFLILSYARGFPHGETNITAAGLEKLGKLPQLKSLALVGYWTGNDTVEALKKLPHLRELYYAVAPDAAKKPDVAALQAALPKCRIETGVEACDAATNKYLRQFVAEAGAPADPDGRAADEPSTGGVRSDAKGDAKPREPVSQ